VRRTLFNISNDLLALDELLEEIEGDVSDEQIAAAIDEWMASLQTETVTKVDNYCALVKEREARGKMLKDEADRMARQAQTEARVARQLKERLHCFFDLQGISKMETPRYKVAVQVNGGVQALEVDRDPADLPDLFRKVIYVADNEAIREALAVAPLPFARLKDKTKSLRIR
jgi:hypothetical protein